MASIRFFLAVGCLGWAADAQDNGMMIELYEEALEETLELESGGWHKLMQASSRGDTASSIATLADACARTGADLSPWAELMEVYGVFQAEGDPDGVDDEGTFSEVAWHGARLSTNRT
jgi:hypothetical protein